MLPKSLVLICRTASIVCNMRSPTICALRLSFFFIWAVFVWMSFTTHNTFFFLVHFSALCPKPWHLKHWKIEGVVLNFSTMKIMPFFWHTSPPESNASACFRLSLFIFINVRSLPVLFDFILSALAWDILLKSSSSWKSLVVMLFDTPLNIKILLFEASAEWYDFGSDTLTFGPKTCFIFVGVSPIKIKPFFCLLDL